MFDDHPLDGIDDLIGALATRLAGSDGENDRVQFDHEALSEAVIRGALAIKARV
jgi:hypothetical protein